MRRKYPQQQRDHDDPAHRDGVGQIHAGAQPLCRWLGFIIAGSSRKRLALRVARRINAKAG
jgi:hypothetical protein